MLSLIRPLSLDVTSSHNSNRNTAVAQILGLMLTLTLDRHNSRSSEGISQASALKNLRL